MDIFRIRNELTRGKTVYDMCLRVTYYARVSTDTDEQLNSLKNQQRYYDEKISNCVNWEFVSGYVDEGISGKSTISREAFNKMITDAKEGLFDLVLTKEISRFARDTLDSIRFTRELLNVGVGVYFENDNINTLFPDSELRLTIMASIAQDEIRKLSERVRFGHKRSIEQGKVLGNNIIWGYRKDNGRLVIVEQEAEMVRLIFDLYANHGLGIRSVCNKLAEMGYKNSSGNNFTFNTIQGILRNPKYKGFYCGKKTEVIDYRTRKRVEFAEEQWIMYRDPDNVPPIVDEVTWERANQILDKRSEKMKSKDVSSYQNKYKYSGKIICDEHGTVYWRSLYKYESGDKELWQCRVYRQSGKKACDAPMLYTDELDSILKEIFRAVVDNKAEYVQIMMQYYKDAFQDEGNGASLVKLQTQLDQLERKKAKLLDMSLDETLSKDDFKKKNAELNAEAIQVKKQIGDLFARKKDEKAFQSQMMEIEKALNTVVNFEDDISVAADMFLERIRVYNQHDDTHIKLHITLRMNNHKALIYGKSEDMRLIPIIHLIRADIETEISPLVGNEKQSEDLIAYIVQEMNDDPNKIWELNMFGKSMHEMVKEGLQNKLFRMPEDAQMKFQETLQKIINEGSGGLICIIL